MEHVLYLRPHAIPDLLRRQDRWVPWRRDGRHKVPLGPDGRPGDVADPDIWQSFREATRPYYADPSTADGVGWVLTGSKIVAIDLDASVDAGRGTLPAGVRALVERFNSYTELSPSGTGLHILLRGTMPDGNRRHRELELLGQGFLTMTGHPVLNGAIAPGGEPLRRIIQAFPPPPTRLVDVPVPVARQAFATWTLIDRAWPNANFRDLWQGRWRHCYRSASEADAAFCQHLARNGGTLDEIIQAWRWSGLQRAKLHREDYCLRTTLLALTTTEVSRRRWADLTMPVPTREETTLMTHLARHVRHPKRTQLLVRLAYHLAARHATGETPRADGFWRVSPAYLAGDQEEAALPHLMSRQGANKALKDLADAGFLERELVRGDRGWWEGGQWHQVRGPVTIVRVTGMDVLSILAGFLHPTLPR